MKSIQTKIVILLLCVVLLSSCVIGIISSWAVSGVLTQKATEQMRLLCESNISKFDAVFEGMEKVAAILAHSIEEEVHSINNITDPKKRELFLKQAEEISVELLNHSNDAIGVHMYLNPQITGEKAGFFWLRYGIDALTFKDDISNVPIYEHDYWWQVVSDSGEAVWTDSYNSTRVGRPFTSYIVPVYHGGVLFAVVGMDISCSSIENTAAQIKAYDTGYAAVLNRSGTVLYHPEYEFGDTISNSRDNAAETAAKAIIASGNFDELISYESDGEQRKMAFGDLRNGMRLCIIAPENEIYAERHRLEIKIISIILFSIIIAMAFALVFAKKLTEPIKKLSYAAREMTEGNMEVEISQTTKDEVGELAQCFTEARDKLKNQMDALYDEVHRDGLTGVNNKLAFTQREESVNLTLSDGNASFAVSIFDVNKLKLTNDVLGHMAGDNLLRMVAGHLVGYFGRNDVFRIGGDEFAVVYEGDDVEDFRLRCAQCAHTMGELTLKEYPQVGISCSFGVSRYTEGRDTDFASVVSRADKKMYKNKSSAVGDRLPDDEQRKGVRELQIEKYLQFLRVLSQSTEDFLFLCDIETDRNWFFGNVNERFGIGNKYSNITTLSELMEVVYPKDREAFAADIKDIIRGKTSEHNMNCRWIMRNGGFVWVNSRARVIEDDRGNPFVLIGRVSVSELRNYHNQLTGLFNKNKFSKDFLDNTIPQFTHLMLVNIDNLAAYNLKSGRTYGDGLLCHLAQVLEDTFALETVYHMEQDNFVVFMNIDGYDEAQRLFDKIQSSLEDKFTISAAVIPNDKKFSVDKYNMYEYARQMLKQSKKMGDGRILFFSNEDYLKNISAVELYEEIEHCVESGFDGFYLCYQPKVNASDYSVSCAEALLRYTSKSRGNVYPDEFIPVLEHTGLINRVGLWVLSSALEQCKAWREYNSDFRVSVNFSGVQFKDEDIADKVIELLERYELPGEVLTIEITETVQLEDTDSFEEIFEKFQDAGIAISIDDFGTGYANMSYLKKIHADEIKVDRVFIQDIKDTAYNYRVVKNIIEFAKSNSFTVCLEGVERAEELAVLETLGADMLQGYLFDKPLTASEFESRYIDAGSADYKNKKDFTNHLKEYKEKMNTINVDTREILSQMEVGLWVMRVNIRENTRELFGDATLFRQIGADEKTPSAECYRLWTERIKPGREDRVDEVLNRMMSDGKVLHMEYPWIDPQRGEVDARVTGKCVQSDGDVVIFEGFNRIL